MDLPSLDQKKRLGSYMWVISNMGHICSTYLYLLRTFHVVFFLDTCMHASKLHMRSCSDRCLRYCFPLSSFCQAIQMLLRTLAVAEFKFRNILKDQRPDSAMKVASVWVWLVWVGRTSGQMH